ncbi:MAG: aldose epimerase [Chloroflexota bacterium]
MPDNQLKVIESKLWQVGILPATGASIAFARIKHNNQWIDLMRPTPDTHYQDVSACASYALIPWSNRIRDGHFKFRGADYQLRVNFEDGTAIHGTAREFPWVVEVTEPSKIFVNFQSSRYAGVNFPWRFSTRMDFRVDGENFTITTWLKNEDTTPMPAGFGHHPHFMRTLASPTDTIQLEIPCAEYFELEQCMPSAGSVAVEPRVDFRQLRPLGSEFIDDCLTGRDGEKPIRMVYGESGRSVTLYFDRLFEDVVLYVPQDTPYFAVEPVTNANDGFNLYSKGIPGSGVFVLEPGQERQATFTLQVSQ